MSLFNKVLSISAILFGTAFIYKVSKRRNSLGFISNPSSTNGNSKESVDSKTEKTISLLSNDRTQKMFKDLGMTKNQRDRYEASLYAVMNDWEKKNPNVGMDEDTLFDKKNKSLKAVLNEVQYGMYRDWTEKYMN